MVYIFEKCISNKLPNESTLKNNYVDNCLNETNNYVRKYIEIVKMWVSMMRSLTLKVDILPI